MSGARRLLPPRGPLGRDPDCCEEETNDRSKQSRYGETRPFRLGHPGGRAGASAAVTRATYEETEDCCEPEGDCYSSRDPWYTQSQSSRPTYDVVWGSQQSRPKTATGMSAAAAWQPEGDDYSISQRHPVPVWYVFKGEIGEKLDDFIFQVEEFATFHEWDPMETCRQARTHLRGVALAYIRRTPLPPRDWTELKTLLTQCFQPRDLTAAYKA